LTGITEKGLPVIIFFEIITRVEKMERLSFAGITNKYLIISIFNSVSS